MGNLECRKLMVPLAHPVPSRVDDRKAVAHCFLFCSKWVTRVNACGPAPTMAISTDFGNGGGSTGDRIVKNGRVALNTLTQYDNDYHFTFCTPTLKQEFQEFMDSIALTAVAGPPGSGKTTWIGQCLQDQQRPLFYCCPGMGDPFGRSGRGLRIAFPGCNLLPESQAPTGIRRTARPRSWFIWS